MHLNLMFLSVFLLMIAGCTTAVGPSGLSYEGKWKRLLEVAEEINKELESVTDKASSEKAAPHLQSLVKEYNDLDKSIDNSSAGSIEQMTRVSQDYMQPLMDELMTIGTHSIKCQLNPDLAAVRDALQQMNSDE